MRFVTIDFETYSETDIKSAGAFKYMEDPHFEILLMAYAMDDGEVQLVDFASGETWPKGFRELLKNPEVLKIAHNAAFERQAIVQATGIYSPPEQWLDTMHLAAQCGLPLSLDGVGKALGFDEDTAKMKEGKALIRYFCGPCKPTKVNGGRTRNLPEHAPEKWETFCEYCKQDVVAERAIFKTLRKWMPNPTERKFWCLDAKINERGVRIDKQLAAMAVAMDKKYKEELTEKAVALTGLENPKSVSQVKNWLFDQEGKEFPSLNKKVIADVVSQLATDEAKQFMAIRTELSKSSTAKYEAMMRSMGEDDHVRGCFQFYGANRTGRFAGRLVQFQNMSKNEMPDIAACRALVRNGKYTQVKSLYDGVSGPLSELVRTAIIPEDGHQWLVADFSAIEARVIAWFADEDWRLDVFRNGGDIYCQSASQMFKVPVVKHGENGHLRQKGKVAELACIAEGQLVLTDKGLVPIEKVTTEMKVWDGDNWVSHDGLVYRGEKEVITYDGLTATSDHLVWIEGESRPVHFGVAASCGARLLQTGDGRNPVRLGRDYQPGETLEQDMESLLRSDEMYELRRDAVADPEQPYAGRIEGMSAVLTAKADSEVVGSATYHGEAEMREPEGRAVSPVRCSRNQVRVPECNCGRVVLDRDVWPTGQSTGVGPDRHERELRSGESTVLDTQRESVEQTSDCSDRMGPAVLAVCVHDGDPEALLWNDQRGSDPGCRNCGVRETEKLARHQGKVRVYDLRNAGPNHRFTVSGVLVHNCGYGGGIGALKAFGADKMGMTEEEMQETVDMWRESSPKIVQMWWDIGKAAARSIMRRAHVDTPYKGVSFDFADGILWMNLPSGRSLAYFGAKYEDSTRMRGKKTINYMGVNQQTKKWERVETYGPKLVENLVQATARDCLRESMLALDEAGFDIRFHIHDECVCTEPRDGRTVEEMAEIMGRPIDWAPGLPLRADGYACDFYLKD